VIFKQLNKASCKTYLLGSENTKEVIVVYPVLVHVNEYISLIKGDTLFFMHIPKCGGTSGRKAIKEEYLTIGTKGRSRIVSLSTHA
jgi:hypothetical protein